MPFRPWSNGFASGLIVGILVTILVGLSVQSASDSFEAHRQEIGYAGSQSDADRNDTGSDQEGMFWGWRGPLITSADTLAQWVMMAFTVVAAGLLWWTLKGTNTTIRLMRNEQRPWLDFTIQNGLVRCERRAGQDPEVFIDIDIVAENFGSSPAVDVCAHIGILTKGTLIVGRSAYAVFIANYLEKGWVASGVVFPGRTAVVGEQWHRKPERQVAPPSSEDAGGAVSLPTENWRLMVCVLYRSSNGKGTFLARHTTLTHPRSALLDGPLRSASVAASSPEKSEKRLITKYMASATKLPITQPSGWCG
jgi:hypothetical protein